MLSADNQNLTVWVETSTICECVDTYFVERPWTVGHVEPLDLTDNDPATREHLLPVNFLDYFSGECLNAQLVNGQVFHGWNIKAFASSDLTIEKCFDLCQLKKYAGLGMGRHCICGDEIFISDILSERLVESWII